MTKQEAAALLETHRNWRKGLIDDYEFNTMFTLQEGDEAVDLAIEALREQPAPEQPAENDLCSVAKRVADGMVGIGGIPDKEEFYAEFASRLFDALGIQPLQFDDLPIDDLPIEDVAIIEMWLESLRMSPSVQSITIRLSDGETLYTVKNERP